jgi:hypothetical protein
MRGKDDSLSEKTVIEHQQSPIEVLKFIVPQDVKNSWPRSNDVFEDAKVIRQDSNEFAMKRGFFALITPQV